MDRSVQRESMGLERDALDNSDNLHDSLQATGTCCIVRTEVPP